MDHQRDRGAKPQIPVPHSMPNSDIHKCQKKSRPSEEEPGLQRPPSQPFHRRPHVKRVQAGILAYGSSYFSPLPTLLTLRQVRTQSSGSGKFRPRSQRRGRPRFARGSLFSPRPPEHVFYCSLTIPQSRTGCQFLSLTSPTVICNSALQG